MRRYRSVTRKGRPTVCRNKVMEMAINFEQYLEVSIHGDGSSLG